MAGVLGRGDPAAAAEVRRVVWTGEAVANLASIASYVNDFSPLAAQRLAVRIRTAAESLVTQPDRGRAVGAGRRELTVIYPYLIRYRVKDEAIYILRIRHGAQQPD